MADERASVIELIKHPPSDDGFVYPYPWRFAVTHNGVRHQFCGLPNKCATAEEALARAQERLTWMEDGTYAEHYRNR